MRIKHLKSEKKRKCMLTRGKINIHSSVRKKVKQPPIIEEEKIYINPRNEHEAFNEKCDVTLVVSETLKQ